MRLTVISGYVMASLFALCGLFDSVQFWLHGGSKNMTDFSHGQLEAGWPLAVAGVIVLLVQILCRLDQLCAASLTGAQQKRNVRAGQTITPNKPHSAARRMPERFFPVHDTTPSAPEQNTESAPMEQDNGSTEDKLHFFKLH